MNEENGISAELPDGIQQQNSVKDNATPSDDRADDEMKAVLSALQSLPFKDEIQKASLLKNVQRLQDYHVAQIFSLGVAPLRTCMTETSEFVEEVIKLFEICFSSCYTADVTKRVAFNYFVKALKFCFPSPPKQCLTTTVVSMLLQLARVLQEGKIAEIVSKKPEQASNTQTHINGPKHFIEELLTIFETRRDGVCITEIVSQTVRFASEDASVSLIQEHVVGNLSLPNEHVVSPVFLRHWMRLLKLEQVSNSFASTLATMDALRVTKESVQFLLPIPLPIRVETGKRLYDSIVCQFVSILEQMKRDGSEVSLPSEEKRLDIYFKRVKHFCRHPSLTVTSLKLLGTTGISNNVLEEVYDEFCFEGQQQQKAMAFEMVYKVLGFFPDGELISKILNLWKQTIPFNADYENLASFMALFVGGLPCESRCCLEERAERTFNFLDWLPRYLLPLLRFWHIFLSYFIKMFPSTFQRRPEVLVFIQKGQLAARVVSFPPPLASVRQVAIAPFEEFLACPGPLQFLHWISQENLTEGERNEMLWLLMCCTSGGPFGHNWEFSKDVIKQLSFCQQLSFSMKKFVLAQLTCFAQHFKEPERRVFQEFVENVSSNQRLELKDAIFSETLDLVARFAHKDRPMKNISPHVMKLLTLVSKAPISGRRRVKILKKAKESAGGLSNAVTMLELTERQHSSEEANEYFDLLYSAFVDILKEKKDWCEQFSKRRTQRPGSSAQVQEVWILESAKLISRGSFKKEIDCDCCLPVLENAREMGSSMEMLQLHSLVRTSAEKLVDLLRRQESEMNSSPSALDRSHCSDYVPGTFISSLGVVVGSNVLSSQEKLKLVEKVCDISLRYPDLLAEDTLEKALIYLIPLFRWESTGFATNENAISIEFNQIIDMLDSPTMMARLTRLIPCGKHAPLGQHFPMKAFDTSSSGKLVDIYRFIFSQEHLDDAFFSHLLLVLEKALRVSTSMRDVLEFVRKLVCIVQTAPPDIIPLVILTYGYLVEHHVKEEDKERFFNEVVMKWPVLLDASVLSYLEVPRLLWKVHSTTENPDKRCELICRVQGILRKAKKLEDSYCVWKSMFPFLQHLCVINKRIACCDLEWLVLHSPLSNEGAALAFDLSCGSFDNMSTGSVDQQLRCFTFSDVQIEEGCFKFVPQKAASEMVGRDGVSQTNFEGGSKGDDPPEVQQDTTVLTPGLIAEKVVLHLKRVLQQGEDLAENALTLWRLVCFRRRSKCEAECATSCSSLDDYVAVILSILAEALSKDTMLFWAKIDSHHLCQCSEVILKTMRRRHDAGDISSEALLKFQTAVYETMEAMRLKTPSGDLLAFGIRLSARCFRLLSAELKQLNKLLENRSPIETISAALGLFQIDIQAAVTVGETVSSWSNNQQAVALIESVKLAFQEGEMACLTSKQSEFVWELVKAFSRFCGDSCKDMIARIKGLIVLFDPENAYGLNRLPRWRQVMIADGFPAHSIDCWCTAFLTTPLEDLSSRDVDAIVYLNSHSLRFVASASQSIKSCIFPEHGFEVSLEKGIKETQTKERLRLARLLGEFINILKVGKPEENRKAALMKEIVVDACDELCEARVKQNTKELYKIRDQKLKALFTEIFGKQCKPDVGLTQQKDGEGSRVATSFARQTSYLHKNLPRVLSCNEVYEPLLLLLRRWLSGIVTKPVLAAHTQEIVQLIFSAPFSDEGPSRSRTLHGIIRAHILSLENNKALIAQLQTAGYNQKDQVSRDLWSSPSVECPGYLSKRESSDSRRYRKKLVQVLRCILNEWKDILRMLGIASIKIGETDVSTEDLFGLQATLEEIEEQVSAVKKAADRFNSEDIERRVTQLVRQEQRHRARIEKLYKNNKNSEAHGSDKGPMEKFVVVWENRFLENVKLCSERIPGCYAPNGFHSEKPVLCALSVDNRILTVFKEDKNGRREEIENVEVKLFEAGMYVYELHTNGHDYVTDELWAAFYKMLLEERLVPRIVLSNESPGFDWIKKHKFVQTETSHPFPLKWELHYGIVPPEEDYFDYPPIQAALWPALYRLSEFITLTRENVSSFQFDDFQDAQTVEGKEERMRQLTVKAIQELTNELHMLHTEDDESIREALARKMAVVVRQTIRISIFDGEKPTVEAVKKLIDMDKLAFKCSNVENTEESLQQYAEAVLRACENVL